jgi:hypothetical protein
MGQISHVEALLYLRKLQGGSQPILVRANDGFFYVVKFLDNLQGTNLLFNEVLGTELFRSAGLLVPEWRLVHVSEDFLDQNHGCWIETESGRRRPKAGWCFGSQFLGLRNIPAFEILPGQGFNRVRNRKDFWTAWVLDTFCGHTDNRQAIFLERDSKWLDAFFIDHGHLFGGASGDSFSNFWASRYLDSRIYASPNENDADCIQRTISSLDLNELAEVANSLPESWKTTSAISNFKRFAHRVSDTALLRGIIHFILGLVENREWKHERYRDQFINGYVRTYLHAQIPQPRGDGHIEGRYSGPVSGQGKEATKAVCPSRPQATNF